MSGLSFSSRKGVEWARLPKGQAAPRFRPLGSSTEKPISCAGVAQLVRALVCGTRGRWFKSTRLYHPLIAKYRKKNAGETVAGVHVDSRLRLAPAVAAVAVTRWRDVARRIGTSAALRAAEHPIEEVVAAAVAVATATIHARRHAHRL